MKEPRARKLKGVHLSVEEMIALEALMIPIPGEEFEESLILRGNEMVLHGMLEDSMMMILLGNMEHSTMIPIGKFYE